MSLVAPGFSPELEVYRLRALYQLLASLARAKSLDDVYESALTSLLASTTADRAAILTFDEADVMRFRAWRGLSEEYRAAVTGHTPWPKGTQNAEPIVVADVDADPEWAHYRELFARESIRSLAFVPLELDEGIFGKFMLYQGEPHQWTPDEVGAAQVIASHVALVLERTRAELERESSEQLLQTILDNSGTIIFLKDSQGRYQLVNRRFEDLFHLTRAQIAGKTDYDIFPPEVASQFQEHDRKVLAAGTPLHVEESVPQQGGIHTYICVKFPIDGVDGKRAGVCGIGTDISERLELETASHRLAAVVESSYDAILTKDLNGIITSWNKAAEELLGYTGAEAIGKPVSFLAPEGRTNEMGMILGRIARGERVEHFETQRKAKDGRILDVSLTVSPIRDRAGRIVGASKIMRDVTDRKRAEEERRRLLQREQEARATAEILNQVGPTLLAEHDPEQVVQRITDLGTALVGAEFGAFLHNLPDEKSGASRDAFAGSPMPRNAAAMASIFHGERIIRSEDVTQDPRYAENPPYLAGEHAPARSYLAAPLISRSGEILGGLFFGHSLPGRFTDQHETLLRGIAAQAAIAIDNARLFEQAEWARSELQRSNEELRRTNEDLEIFAYSASHDLQEPLRTVSLSSELLRRTCGNRLSEDEKRFLDGILHGARAMSQLITDLLAYTTATKAAEGPPPLTDSNTVLNDVLRNLKSAIDNACAHVTATQLPEVSMHETRLAQVFQNLIGNALKYRGKEAPCVHVSACERDGWTIFSVEDNGMGIEPEYASQIFGLFKRLHSGQKIPGSGLGLAICQRLVEHYGGRIWLDKSTPGSGSTFCFAVPARSR